MNSCLAKQIYNYRSCTGPENIGIDFHVGRARFSVWVRWKLRRHPRNAWLPGGETMSRNTAVEFGSRTAHVVDATLLIHGALSTRLRCLEVLALWQPPMRKARGVSASKVHFVSKHKKFRFDTKPPGPKASRIGTYTPAFFNETQKIQSVTLPRSTGP